MASSPVPYLLGIILVAQTRASAGAQILFHYPPDPLAQDERHVQDIETPAADLSSSSDSDGESSSDDNVYEIAPSKYKDYRQDDRTTAIDNGDIDEYSNILARTRSDERWKPSWEPLLGIGQESLVSLLAPGRAWHKRKFELGINDLVFVGRPVYVRESGNWQKRRRKRQASSNKPTEPDSEPSEDDASNTATHGNPKDASPETQPEPTKSALTMFNVVFVMVPPALEHNQRVKDMYDNVIRKLSKVLKWEQANNDYVWSQTDLIQTIKSTHYTQQSSTNTLYNDLIKQSSLASAVATTYRAISTSRIAAVTLSPQITLSLQIPPITSTSYLPSLTEPPIQPGIWLTTVNDGITTHSDLDVDTANPENALQLAKSFTLLLRDQPQKILEDIQATSGPLALPLAEFITSLTPAKSFYKISQRTALPLGDMQLLSRHLISWRRAMAIPPLHHRDTYIVSPNADFSLLTTAIKSFEATFPMLPSLPRFLALLSGPPAPFGTLIPSSDHKEEYYRVLAWLLRGGWVTQLRTFAYIRVSPTIKQAVRDQDRQDKRDTTQDSLKRLNIEPDQSPNNTTRSQLGHSLPKHSTSHGGSTTSTSFGGRDKQNVQFRNRPHLSRPPSSSTTTTTTTTATRTATSGPQHNPSHASLIASPLRASALENKWLNFIQSSLTPSTTSDSPDSSPPTTAPTIDTTHPAPTDSSNHPKPEQNPSSDRSNAAQTTTTNLWTHLPTQQRQELHEAWPRLTKYFNGQEALERIAFREGWKRKWVVELLERLPGSVVGGAGSGSGSGGSEVGKGASGKEDVVVMVRHW